MTSRPLVDPELLPFLDAWPAVTLSEEILYMVRARVLPLSESPSDEVMIEHRLVPGPVDAPDIALSLYRPSGAVGDQLSSACIYHIHGGGFVTGKASDFEGLHRQLVVSLGCMVIAVDYRLAPETRYPGAIADCYAGLVWVSDNASSLGIDAARIGVMGESAGGGLAAALALLARDKGGPALAFQCLSYPMLDDRTCVAKDPHPHAGEFIWPPHNNSFGWRALLGCDPGGVDVGHYAAAARAADLSGLPRTYIMTGALDLFLEEDVEYARRLWRAGVSCDLNVYPGAFHGFDFAPDAAVSIQARKERIAFLEKMVRCRS
ncbi:MAG: alpha/beta hydrolase [Sphingomonadales bacterium]|nr:MAG: alpha/beta hydrolase [Sphingomonadales bacterium]